MARAPRRFEVKEGRRTQTPLLIGLDGPSGGGKTYSALELATGIKSVVGGEIVMIDTENRRGLHYADKFDFKHIDFQPPFGSLDYLDALQFAVNEYGAKTIIVDSMSHEHEGPGGLLASHEAEAVRMATYNGVFDEKKLERVKMLAWNKPKQARRALLNGMIRLNANIIMCFRAKSSSKPVKVEKNGRTITEVQHMGWVPIAGDEFVFEMTLAGLLKPGARGVPDFFPEFEGERLMAKLPDDFMWLHERAMKGVPLDRKAGAALARWASGEGAAQSKPAADPEPQDEPDENEQEAEPQAEPRHDPEPAQSDDEGGYEGV